MKSADSCRRQRQRGNRRRAINERRRPLRLESLENRRVLAAFTVSTDVDESDGDFTAGDFSLREAIEQANATGGQDEILFDSSLAGNTFALSLGELYVADSVTIQGLGAADTIIDAQQNSRVFNIDATAAQVILANITITGGHVTNQSGGGILNASGDLIVRDSVVTGNTAEFGDGGGISNDPVCGFSGCVPTPTITIQGSEVSNNVAIYEPIMSVGGNGGGITNGHDLIVTDSTISNNAAERGGGGLSSLENFGTPMLEMKNSVVSSNSALFIGGIHHSGGSATISDSVISGNAATGGSHGGVGSSYADVLISHSVISNNSATSRGGGIGHLGSGAMTVVASTISDNIADNGGAIDNLGTMLVIDSTLHSNSAFVNGGAVWDRGRDFRMINSTMSDNSAGGNGGALYSSHLNATLENSTLTNNTAGQDGGGIWVSNWETNVATLSNTIVAGNHTSGLASGADVFLQPDDEFNPGGTLVVQSSLIGVGDGTGLVNGVDGNQVGTAASPLDPQLGSLADNGGTTLTHALLAGSPAIDSGDATLIAADIADVDGDGNTTEPIPFDQRGDGFPRVSGSQVDLGAFELQTVLESNVTAEVIDHPTYGRVLVINGDMNANHVVLIGGGGSALLVAGVDGTTVNGKSVDGFTQVRHVQLNLGDGNDSVTIDQLSIRGRLDINAGAGDDEIVIRRSEVNSLTANTGCGNDSMQLEHTKVFRKTRVAMGAGDDHLAVIDSYFGGNAIADGGPGDDLLTLLGENQFHGIKKAKHFEHRG